MHLPEQSNTLPAPRDPEALCTAAPRNAGHRNHVKSQWELGELTSTYCWEKQRSATACKGTLQHPRHDLAVAVDMSILQFFYSHNWGKLPQKYSQGLLLSCKKNVTRKQPCSQNLVIFSLSLFSSVSGRQSPPKSLAKTLPRQLAN